MKAELSDRPEPRPRAGVILGVITAFLLLLAACSSPAAPESAEGPQVEPGNLTQSLFAPDGPLSGLAAAGADETEELLRLTAAGELVRVIVELDAPVKPESLLSATAVTDQRAAIASAQEVFLDDFLQQGFAATDASSIRRLRTMPLVAMTVDLSALVRLLGDPAVVRVVKDELSRPLLDESIPLIGADDVWADDGFDGSGWAVAILDSGVEVDHPFLQGKTVVEACFSTSVTGVSDSLCPSGENTEVGPESATGCDDPAYCSHGTHVAGIAAGAATPDGDGSTLNGVAKGASIIAIQVFADFGGDVLSYSSDQIAALEFLLDLSAGQVDEYPDFETPIAAANMSLGGGYYTATCDLDPRKPVIDALRAEGIATIIAAGNDSEVMGISSPACISTSVSVGSSTMSDGVSWFSNNSDYVRLFAPGSGIMSSVLPGAYQSYNGTSMAAPHVAGAWALLRQSQPDYSVGQILSMLASTGQPITDNRAGAGGRVTPRIQLDAAVGASPAVSSAPSLRWSTLLSAEQQVVLADGSGSTVVTVELRDDYSDLFTSSVTTVEITTDHGDVGQVTDNGDGTFSATLTASQPGVALVSATVDGSALLSSPIAVIFHHPKPEPRGRAILWNQLPVGTSGIVSSVSSDTAAGYFSIADFTITEPVELEYIFVDGFLVGTDVTALTTIHWYIFANASVAEAHGNEPAGLPHNAVGATDGPIWAYEGGALELGSGAWDFGLALDLAQLEEGPLALEPGRYWLVVAPEFPGPLTSAYRWYRWQAAEQASVGMIYQNQRPADGWMTLPNALLNPDFRDLAFQLRGRFAAIASSTIESDASVLPADATSTTQLTVALLDDSGESLGHSGGEVTLSSTLGTVGPVTDNGDGTYSAVFTSGEQHGTAVITAELAGEALEGSASITLTPVVDPETSTLTADESSLPADGTSTANLTVQLVNIHGTNLDTSAGQVVFSTTAGTVTAATDNGDGTYSATFTSGTAAGSATVSATLDGTPLVQTASITLTGLPSAAINFTGTAAANFTATPGQQAAPLLSFTASVPAGASTASLSQLDITVSNLSGTELDARGIASLEAYLDTSGDGTIVAANLLGSTSTIGASGIARISLTEALVLAAGSQATVIITVTAASSSAARLQGIALAGLFGVPLAWLALSRNRRRVWLLSAALAISLLLAACGGGTSPTPQTTEYRYGTELSAVTVSSAVGPVQVSGLPIKGAEVKVNLPAH